MRFDYSLYLDVIFFFLCDEGRELQGLKAYFKARIKDLYVPFMVLIDYRGFRMIGKFLGFLQCLLFSLQKLLI
jgi:hypothetical protein